MRGKVGILLGGVAGVLLVAAIVWAATRESAGERAEGDAASAPDGAFGEDEPDELGWLGPEGDGEGGGPGGAPAGGETFGDQGGDDGVPGARRRWEPGQPMPERMRKRFEIVPLGDRPPTVQAEQLFETLRAQRPAIRACAEQAGGWRALREKMRADRIRAAGDQPPGRPRPPRASFDLDANGRVVPGSLAIEPPLPDAVQGCVLDVISAAPWPAAGGDGARVEVPMGGGRGGRGKRGGFVIDGGVPRRNDRGGMPRRNGRR